MNEKNKSISFGSLKLEPSTRKFYVGKNIVSLRNKEFCLLEYFMTNIGIVLSRTQILEDVWDHNICCPTNTVDVHVSNLRQKLKSHKSADLIKTIHCVGYIFEP